MVEGYKLKKDAVFDSTVTWSTNFVYKSWKQLTFVLDLFEGLTKYIACGGGESQAVFQIATRGRCSII